MSELLYTTTRLGGIPCKKLAREEEMATQHNKCYHKKDLALCDCSMKECCESTLCRGFIMSHSVEAYSLLIMGSCKCCDVCEQYCTYAACKT